MVTKDYPKSRMRENCTYGSVRGGQSNLIPSTRLRRFKGLRGWRWRLTPQILKKERHWRSRIEGISAAGRSFSRLFTKPYDTESQSRNADFILIAQEGDTTTLGAKGPVKLKNPPAVRLVHLKNPHTEGVSIHLV